MLHVQNKRYEQRSKSVESLKAFCYYLWLSIYCVIICRVCLVIFDLFLYETNKG